MIYKEKTAVSRNGLQGRKALRTLFLVSTALLGMVLVLRYGILEAGVFPTDCAADFSGDLEAACIAKWMLVQSFLHQRLGWASLAFGVAAFVSRKRPLAWTGWAFGIAGLVLYGFDYAAVGALLSLLVLVREGPQRGRGEHEARREPSDGLRIQGLR